MKISRLADYALVLTAHMAAGPGAIRSSVRELAAATGVPRPTVAKLLKQLGQAQIVRSWRGPRGGYELNGAPQAFSLADVIEAIDGPLALTACARGDGFCDLENRCGVLHQMRQVDHTIRDALARVSLAVLAAPPEAQLLPLRT